MYGSLCVIISVGIWLILASHLEMPVSTTHSCVGGIIGMTLVARGPDCVLWAVPSSTFPYIKGVGAIVVSWFLSPIASAICAVALFTTVRALVLRHKEPFERAFLVYPALVAFTLFVNSFFIIYKGAPALGLNKTPLGTAVAASAAVGAAAAGVTFPLLGRLRRRIISEFQRDDTDEGAKADTLELVQQRALRSDAQMPPSSEGQETDVKSLEEGRVETSAAVHKNDGCDTHAPKSSASKATIAKWMNASTSHDPHASLQRDRGVGEMHAQAEAFDDRAEAVFRYLQIFTACCDSFAHGANDVANAIGPFAAIYSISQSGEVSKKNDMGTTGYLVLLLGGVGIAAGLLLYGYKIMSALGVKLAKITPSRGFSIELGAAMIVIIGSRLGWPLSTTHCQVGATTGVALLEGTGGVNKRVLLKTIIGWVITLIVVGATTALLFAWGVYSPTLHHLHD